MSVGRSANKAEIDAWLGNVVAQLREGILQAAAAKVYLDKVGGAGLTALGYTDDDLAKIDRTITPLAKLAAVAQGQDTQAQVSDFFFWAWEIAGPQYR